MPATHPSQTNTAPDDGLRAKKSAIPWSCAESTKRRRVEETSLSTESKRSINASMLKLDLTIQQSFAAAQDFFAKKRWKIFYPGRKMQKLYLFKIKHNYNTV